MSLPADAARAAENTVNAAVASEKDAAAASTGDKAYSDAPPADGESAKDPEKPLTVFDDRNAFTVKHPLNSTWELWFDSASKADKAKSWEEALQKIISFDTVEEFWALYNNIVVPSHVPPSSNYYLFRKGIKPAWEDPANSRGGKWSVQLPRDRSREHIDTWWLYTVLAAIGETFETPYQSTSGASAEPASFTNEVTGVIVSSRKAFYRINIWTRHSGQGDKAIIDNIGRHFKYNILSGNRMGEGKSGIASDVEFVSHEASQNKMSKPPKWNV